MEGNLGKLVLSASVLGSRCLRKLWFVSRGYRGRGVEEETQRIFDIGKALEPVAIEWEKRKGREVFYNAKSHEDPPDFILDFDRGVIVGRFDAIFDREILIDIKTCNVGNFVKLLEGKIPQEWLVQVNVYFFGLKLGCCRDELSELVKSIKKVGIYGVHKETGRTVEVVKEPDLCIFENTLRCAVQVFCTDDPLVLEFSEYECKWCEFIELCKEFGKQHQ